MGSAQATTTLCCIKPKYESLQKNGRSVPFIEDGVIVNELAPDFNSDGQQEGSNDNDAAVNYALKRNRTSMRENHKIKEMLISASSLPNALGSRPNTFAILYVNLHSLDQHDKHHVGGLSEK